MLGLACILLGLSCLFLSIVSFRLNRRIAAIEEECGNLRHAHDSLAEFSLKAVRGHE